MTTDGFLQFLGLVVAVFALLGVVNRYRLRLLGWWLWAPSLLAFIACVYLLLFDVVGVECSSRWCSPFELPTGALTPSKLAFVVVLTWLIYVALLVRFKSIGTRPLPSLFRLVDRLVSEKRFPELVDLIEPHVQLIAQCGRRELPLQRLRDTIQWQDNPLVALASVSAPNATRLRQFMNSASSWLLKALKPVEARLPKTSPKQEAALSILRVLYTNGPLVEFIALERSTFALRLMLLGGYDYDFGDRAFGLMMAHPQSQLRRETLLNQNTGLCFYEIDPKNPLIHALFADAKVAEKLEVYRPVGNYPLQLLRESPAYRQTISATKPDERLIHADPTYGMIRFFDIMIRSAMRDGINWHMWVFYFDILVDNLLKATDPEHPDYDRTAEFPNFAYYLIYEVFDAYGDWLRVIQCCPEDSPVVQFGSTAPIHDNGSILKSTILSVGVSLRHLLRSKTEDTVITYLLGMLMRDYRDLEHRKNGGLRVQEALRNSLLNGGYHDLAPVELTRLADCYAEIDPFLQFETKSFEEALTAALP